MCITEQDVEPLGNVMIHDDLSKSITLKKALVQLPDLTIRCSC